MIIVDFECSIPNFEFKLSISTDFLFCIWSFNPDLEGLISLFLVLSILEFLFSILFFSNDDTV